LEERRTGIKIIKNSGDLGKGLLGKKLRKAKGKEQKKSKEELVQIPKNKKILLQKGNPEEKKKT